MSNIVRDVLAAVGSKSNTKGNMGVTSGAWSMGDATDLLTKAENVQINVCHNLELRYTKFTPGFQDTNRLADKLTNVLNEMSALEYEMEHEDLTGVESSVGEVGEVVKRWRETTAALATLQTLLNVSNCFEEAQKSQRAHHFLESTKSIAEARQLLEQASTKDIDEKLDIIVVLKEELIVKEEQLRYTLGEVWNETIRWDGVSSGDSPKVTTLTVCYPEKTHTDTKTSSMEKTKFENIHDMFKALHFLGELDRKTKTFGKKLMNCVFKPIIQSIVELKVLEERNSHVLQIKQWPNDTKKMDAEGVFSAVKEVLNFLRPLCEEVLCEDEPDKEVTFMTFIGNQIGKELTDLLIRDCIAEAVPCKSKDLESFATVSSGAHELHTFFIEKGFYSTGDTTMLEYASNVDMVFSNKACAHLLEKARELMKRPLHITVSVALSLQTGELVLQNEAGEELTKSSMRLEKMLSSGTFLFPKCKISASVCELVDLIYEIMEEACQSSPQYAGRLFYTVRNILTMYSSVVPTAHAHVLSTLPQPAAIVHNSAMYLAHHALSLGQQYHLRLPKPLRDSTITTTDLAQRLRYTATSTFLQSMKKNRTSLLDTLRDSSLFETIGSHATLVPAAEQHVKQILHQLELLKKVWQNVLPQKVYTKSMGILVGSVIEEVITRVVGLEDISAEAALSLINVMNILKDNIPPLFQVEDDSDTSPGDVVQNVRYWLKFCELIILLEASLRDILDRWADGKGPLAHQFTTDEVKQLIRALFQNTDRRAQVLAKIK
ncbi:zeste-white 10 kinetochore protein isoform X2 [Oratosquilla oratoria]|uniref:zeste-white 10 kinetochore protein isoform X2 n=1 Tax=Oratosquilla oratoria TaxID=337810 RepID=UPI003F7733E7